MKTILLVIVTVMVTIFTNWASASPSVSIGSSLTNKYLASGTGSVLSKDPAVQSDVFVLFENGVYVDLWNSRSLKGSWDDGSLGNELDYSLGWKGQVAKDLKLNLGASYYDEPKVFSLGKGDILYTYVFLTKDVKHLSVTAGYENYLTMPNSGFHGGNLISVGANKSWSFCKEKISLGVSSAVVYDFGTLGTERGLITRSKVGIDWKAGKQFVVNVLSARWFVPLTSHDRRSSEIALTAGVTWNSK